MIIIGGAESTKYEDFFKNDPKHQQIRSTQFIPESCKTLWKDK